MPAARRNPHSKPFSRICRSQNVCGKPMRGKSRMQNKENPGSDTAGVFQIFSLISILLPGICPGLPAAGGSAAACTAAAAGRTAVFLSPYLIGNAAGQAHRHKSQHNKIRHSPSPPKFPFLPLFYHISLTGTTRRLHLPEGLPHKQSPSGPPLPFLSPSRSSAPASWLLLPQSRAYTED